MSVSLSGLAFHTTTSTLGLGLSTGEKNFSCQTWNLGKDLSTHLHAYLWEFIQPYSWEDFAFLAVAKGPGGFTGTRLGLVTARTLAQALNIPVFAFSSSAIVAMEYLNESEAPLLAIEMRARRGQVFGAIYKKAIYKKNTGEMPLESDLGTSLETYLEDSTFSPEDWARMLNKLKMPYQLIKNPNNLEKSIEALLELALREWETGKRPHWSEVLPFYGQHPVKVK